MRITKASFSERQSHRSGNDLYGYVRINGHNCIIEYDGRVSRGASSLVVAAPKGFLFRPGDTQHARFDSLPALQVRLKELSLEPAA
jgi:hypothetical protein